ncbi:MAG: glycosyltransferase family 39 protein [Myxococcota bacterium]
MAVRSTETGAFAVCIAVGAGARLWNLSGQIFGGDEFHAVRAALILPVSSLYATYQQADPSLPLATYGGLLLAAGLPLSDLALRVPVLVAGVAAVGLLPLLARRWIGHTAALLFAALLALSPNLVLYSRIARPYMPIALLAPVAAFLFLAWWQRQGGLGRLGGYAMAAAAASYFSPLAGPAAAAPLLYGLGDVVLRRGRGASARRGLTELGLAGAALAALVALFLVPGWESLWEIVSSKQGGGTFRTRGMLSAPRLAAGSEHWPVAVLFWGVAAWGALVLWRRSRSLSLLCASLVTVHLGFLAVVQPLGVQDSVVLNRYLIVLLPILLLAVACGLGDLIARLPATGRLAPGLSVILLTVGWVAAGPLVQFPYRAGSFAHHNAEVVFTIPPSTLRLPEIYERLDGDGALLEFPWPTEWFFGRAYPVYQRAHRRPVLVATDERVFHDDRLALRTLVRPEPADLLASRARWLVVHLDLMGEWSPRVGRQRALRLRRSGERLASRLERLWGPPDHRSMAPGPRIAVWDLDRLRSRAGK